MLETLPLESQSSFTQGFEKKCLRMWPLRLRDDVLQNLLENIEESCLWGFELISLRNRQDILTNLALEAQSSLPSGLTGKSLRILLLRLGAHFLEQLISLRIWPCRLRMHFLEELIGNLQKSGCGGLEFISLRICQEILEDHLLEAWSSFPLGFDKEILDNLALEVQSSFPEEFDRKSLRIWPWRLGAHILKELIRNP